MKTISEQLIQLNQIKSNIKQAIIDKGVSVSDSDGFATYANKISAISGGGGSARLVIETGTCFGYSKFTSLPSSIQNADWSNTSSMYRCFFECADLTSITLSGLTRVQDMQRCFYHCYKLSNFVLSGISNVTSISYCFDSCSRLASVSSSELNAINMDGCFQRCTALSSVVLPALTRTGTLSSCFNTCTGLKSITLSGLSNVTTMQNCFAYDRAITTITLSGLSILSNVVNCFQQCTRLENLIVDSWGTVITNLTMWGISNCTSLTHDSLINLINALYTTNVTRTCTIGTTNLAKLSADEIAIATNKGWTLN